MFSVEEIYGCSREDFCLRTGTTMEEMGIRLKKEVTILEVSLATKREEYRNGGSITDEEQRIRARLIKTIENKIKRKNEKIKDIERNME